ncbi:MAG: hypothetical protein H0U65_04780 [Rubrobacter sp.]|nr:hypothetical protein [Rubrobacter sp.]
MANPFEENYPVAAQWAEGGGWIEIGHPGHIEAFIAALDEGGLIWGGEKDYDSVDEALRDLESGLAEWIEENR